MANVSEGSTLSILMVKTAPLRSGTYAFCEKMYESSGYFKKMQDIIDEVKHYGKWGDTVANMDKDIKHILECSDNLTGNADILASAIIQRYIDAEENILYKKADKHDTSDDTSGGSSDGKSGGESGGKSDDKSDDKSGGSSSGESDGKSGGESGGSSDGKSGGESGGKSDGSSDGKSDGAPKTDGESETDDETNEETSESEESSESEEDDDDEWTEANRYGNVEYDDCDFFRKRITREGKFNVGFDIESGDEDSKHIDVTQKSAYLGTFTLGARNKHLKNLNEKVDNNFKDGENKKYQIGPLKGSEKYYSNSNGAMGEIGSAYFEIGAGVEATWSLARAYTESVGDFHSASAEAYVLQAHAEASAGIGVSEYKMDDGTITQFYGAHAEAGASFTLAGANASFDVGPACLGAGAGVEAVFGKASAEGQICFGYVQGQGWAIGASGSLEADLVKYSGEVHGRLVGVEVKAEAAVKIGVGVSGSIGFEGGKFKLGGSVALGLGIEFNISLDFSKVGNALREIGSLFTDSIKSAGESVAKGLKSAASGIKSAVCKLKFW